METWRLGRESLCWYRYPIRKGEKVTMSTKKDFSMLQKACKSRQDRAALCRGAAAKLFWLCDACQKLKQYLYRSNSSLDEETSVLDGIMEEFSMLLLDMSP
jgi:hypothetical protein